MDTLKYIFLVFVICFISMNTIEINAQSPGYQGKNVYISYDATPRFPKTITDDSGLDDGSLVDSTFVVNGDSSFTVNLKHTVGVHYIFTRNMSIGLEYTFHQPRYFENYFTSDIRNTTFKVKATQFGLNFKWYNFKKRGFIAPVGSFIEVRPSMYLVDIEKDNMRTQPSDEVVFTEVKDGYTGLGLSVAYGMQTVWAGRLVPSYKVGITILPNLYTFSPEASNGDITASELPKMAAGRSIGARSGFISNEDRGVTLDVTIGLGILLF